MMMLRIFRGRRKCAEAGNGASFSVPVGATGDWSLFSMAGAVSPRRGVVSDVDVAMLSRLVASRASNRVELAGLAVIETLFKDVVYHSLTVVINTEMRMDGSNYAYVFVGIEGRQISKDRGCLAVPHT